MTKQEFHTYFKIAMDKNAQGVAFGGCPAFLPEEIDYWLDRALYRVVLTKYNGAGESKAAFEKSIKRMHDLEGLIRTDANLATAESADCENACKLDGLTGDKRMLFVSARLNFGDKKAIIRILDHNNTERFKKTYNNIPWIEEPVAVIENNSMIVYFDPVSMKDGDKTIDLTYIKQPGKISELPEEDTLTELPEHVYQQVIDEAVVLALEDIESQRVQNKNSLNQNAD